MLRVGVGRAIGHFNRLPQGVSSGGTGGPPAFAALVARPTPTGTTYTVTTATPSATIASTYASCLSGDCLQFDDGVYDQNACFPLGYNKAGVIIRAKNIGAYDADPMGGNSGSHWARFTRMVTFLYKSGLGGTTSTISASNVTIHDILHKSDNATIWPADNALWSTTCTAAVNKTPWGFLAIASGIGGASIIYNEFSMGYGTTGAAFDPTVKLADFNSPATFTINADGSITSGGTYTGHGDATFLTYNRVLWGPYAVVGPYVGSGFTFYGNYVHDMSHGLNGIVPAGGAYLEMHNWFTRSYHDFGTISSGSATPPTSMHIDQNVWQDPFGDPLDNGNPHVDTSQIFWSITGGGTVRPFGIRASRNLLMCTASNVRGSAQLHFFQLSGGHYAAGGNDVIAIAPKIRENIGVMSGTSHATDLAVSEDFYFRGNECWHPDSLSNGTSVTSAAMTVDSAYGISTARSNKGLFADNVMESDVLNDGSGTAALVQKTNNALLGPRGTRAIAEASVFTGSGVWPTTPYAAFQYRKKQAGYSTVGTQQADIAHFLLDTLSFTGERPFLGFIDQLNQTAGATITSNPAWVHGGNPGDVLSFAPDTGVTWYTVSATDRTTVVQAAKTTSGSVTVDSEYVVQQVTAPTQGTSITKNSLLGGVAMPWTVSSASTAVYPIVQFDGTNYLTRSGTTGLAADGQKMTLALKLKFPAAAPAANITLFGESNGNTFQLLLLTTGALRLIVKNSAATVICQWTSPVSLCDGNTHTILIKVDMAQTTAAAGFSAVVDGVTSGTAPTTFDTSGTQNIYYSRTSSNYRFGSNATASAILSTGQLSFIYLNTVAALDVTNTTIQSKFNADQIVNNGSGPSGAQPAVFLVGNATQFEAGATSPTGSQWGSDVAWTRGGTNAITDVTAGQAAWA